MAAGTIRLPAAWNGPPASANGGVAAGALAQRLIDHHGLDPTAAVTVRLSAPPPLDTEMDAVPVGVGEPVMEMRHDSDVVATARVGEVDLVPPRVSRQAAEAATGPADPHPAPDCVVCGSQRPDTLGVHPNPVLEASDGEVTTCAALWRPPAWAAGPEGHMPPELVWGVLDCPGAFASFAAAGRPEGVFVALGTTTGQVLAPVIAGEETIVVSWSLGSEGRKLHAGTAILDTDGNLLARSTQTCIAMPAEWATG